MSRVTKEALNQAFAVRYLLEHNSQYSFKGLHVASLQSTPSTVILVCTSSAGLAADGTLWLLPVAFGFAATTLVASTTNPLALV